MLTMALFTRNKKNTVVLPELEKYYEAERRERSGLAWILAAVSVAGVVLILIGAFFGGRWIYRQNKNDKPAPVAVVQEDASKTDQKDTAKDKDTANAPSEDTSKPAPAPAAPTTPAPAAIPAAPAPVVATPTQLANTGPESVIPAFVAATTLGTVLYRRKLSRQ